MFKNIIFAVIFVITLTNGCTQGIEVCDTAPEYAYELETNPATIEAARVDCETKGGELAYIHDDNLQELYDVCMDGVTSPNPYHACWIDYPVETLDQKYHSYINVNGVATAGKNTWQFSYICQYQVN